MPEVPLYYQNKYTSYIRLLNNMGYPNFPLKASREVAEYLAEGIIPESRVEDRAVFADVLLGMHSYDLWMIVQVPPQIKTD